MERKTNKKYLELKKLIIDTGVEYFSALGKLINPEDMSFKNMELIIRIYKLLKIQNEILLIELKDETEYEGLDVIEKVKLHDEVIRITEMLIHLKKYKGTESP